MPEITGRLANWLSASDAVRSIADQVAGERSAQDLISSWIGEGKLPTRARALERFPSGPANWGDDNLPEAEARRLGFVKPNLPGMLRHCIELTDKFWSESRNWETDYSLWDWDRGDFVVGYRQLEDDPNEASYWLAKHVIIKARPLQTLFRLWQGAQPSQPTFKGVALAPSGSSKRYLNLRKTCWRRKSRQRSRSSCRDSKSCSLTLQPFQPRPFDAAALEPSAF